MPLENVAVVRGMWEALLRNDFDSALSAFAPDVESDVFTWAVTTRGRASGVPLSHEYAWVATLSDGKVIHQQEYLNHSEALEAVGLRE